MAAVTIDAGAQNSYYSAGNLGWSARSLFAYRTAIQQLAQTSVTSIGDVAATTAAAQGFTPGANIDVSDIRVGIIKVASPTDNLTLEIWSDTGANLPNASIATADNVFNGAAMSNTFGSWLEFHFNTPVSLTSGTKYWIVVQRTGSLDGTNFYRWYHTTGSLYAGGGRSALNTGVWGAESASIDLTFQILTETPSALYAVTQSTTPELHVWKSTDSGATWNEQDAANNPTVTNANYPFDACDTRSGPYIGTARFTATNTIRAALFDMSTDLWGTDLGAADASTTASNERSIRIRLDNTFVTASPGTQVVAYTSVTDDADLRHSRRTSSTWVTDTLFLSITSTEASLIADVIADKSPIGFMHRFYYDVNNDDLSMRSLTATTQGTETDVVTDAADVETEHASATYQIYQASGVDKIVAAFINADGSIQERTATLEVTSASVTLGTEHAVGTATTTAGRQLSTCEYGGDLYVMANVSGTGLTYYIDAGAAGSWDSGTSHVSGLTACTLSQVANIPGVGLVVVYTDNGDAKFDVIISEVSGGATGTATVGTATATGGTHTGTGIAHQTGTHTVGTASAAGGTHSATAGAIGTATVGTAPAAGGTHTGLGVAHQTGTATVGTAAATGGAHTAAVVQNETSTSTVGTAPAAGGTHTASAATIGTSTVGTAPAAGGTHTGVGVVNETGTHTLGTAPASGGSHSATAGIGTTGTTTVGTAPAAGGTHAGTAATRGNATVGTCAAAGGTHTGTAGLQATGTTTVGTASAAGGTHTGSFVANQTGTATVGTAAAAGGDHSAFAAGADEGAHVRGTATADGGTHTGIVTASTTTVTGTASAAGGTHSGAYGATGTHTAGSVVASGGTHTGSAGATGQHTVGEATAAGGTHSATANATGTAVVGTASASGGTHTAVADANNVLIVGTATATGGDHTGIADTTGVLTVGTAAAAGFEHLGGDGSAVDATGNAIVGTATATGGTHTAVVIMPSIIIYTIRYRSPSYTITHPVDDDEYTISRSSDEYTVRRR